MFHAKWLRVLTWVLLAVSVVGCAVNPVSGKRELMLFSEKEEIDMGAQTDRQIRIMYGLYDDPRLNDYVRRVGMKLQPYTQRQNLAYHFSVLDTPVVNAFAAPGGYIYVTRGILALLNNEAELAVIVGHELGHVNARHTMHRLSEQVLLQVGLILGSVISRDFARVAGLLCLGSQLLFLKYSRDDEYQADELGIAYSRQAGYDPEEMIQFFRALQSMEADSGSHAIPAFLSTHPLTQKRIQRAYSLLTAEDQKLQTGRDQYLSQVDGLVFGENPRQGYVEGNRFYHPEMAFSMEIPAGWQMENTARQVVFTEKSGKAALVLQAEPGSGDLADYLQAKAKDFTQAKVIDQQRLTIGGFAAYQALYQMQQQEGQLISTQLTTIKKEGTYFTFTAVTSSNDYGGYAAQFDRVARSFAPLRDAGHLNRAVRRLGTARASGQERLQDIFQRSGVDKPRWKGQATLNAMALDSIPPRGQLIKIAR